MQDGAFKRCAFEALKAAAAAVIFSLAATLAFAGIIKLFSLPSEPIAVVVRIIKAAAVFAGIVLFVREEKGIFKGAAAGAVAAAVTYFIFSAIAGEEFSPLFFAEVLFGGVIGGISGIIAVNIRK